jgi:hypothetical protein
MKQSYALLPLFGKQRYQKANCILLHGIRCPLLFRNKSILYPGFLTHSPPQNGPRVIFLNNMEKELINDAITDQLNSIGLLLIPRSEYRWVSDGSDSNEFYFNFVYLT